MATKTKATTKQRVGAGTKKSRAAVAVAKVPEEIPSPAAAFRDRIKDFRRVPAAELAANPKNWRTHSAKQAGALVGVLQEIGIADALIARENADGTLQLIDGHLRRDVFGARGEELVPVLVLDVTESEADKLLLTLDPLAAMAGANTAALEELLRGSQTGEQALADLFTDLAKEHKIVNFVAEEAAAETIASNDPEQYGVIVICADEAQQRAVFEKLQAEGYECKVVFT